MRDRKYLSKFKWKYIVVDEGHRIKNLNCKLVRELKAYTTANRLLLTGNSPFLSPNFPQFFRNISFKVSSYFSIF
jgi:ATP-dependent DNA helicase